MRRIIVTEFISLDGVIEAPGGNETDHPHAGWQAGFDSEQAGQYKVEELARVDGLLLGRTTYENFAAYWPGQTGEAFADPINRMPKYVVSGSLQQVYWQNSHILRNMAGEVSALKASGNGDLLVYGSATLVRGLLHHNLIDELRLMIYPLSLGGGLRLFDDKLELKRFELKQARMIDKGILILEYLPIR